MKTYTELNENLILESFLDEMANLTHDDTGLEHTIWLGAVKGHHGPRIKVSNNYGRMNSNDCFVVTISKVPVVETPNSCKLKQYQVDDIIDWIKLNYDVLMKLWNVYETGTGSSVELMNQLKKI